MTGLQRAALPGCNDAGVCPWLSSGDLRLCQAALYVKGSLDKDDCVPSLLLSGFLVLCVQDTDSTQQHWPFPHGKWETGYAYIMTHPGMPTVM